VRESKGAIRIQNSKPATSRAGDGSRASQASAPPAAWVGEGEQSRGTNVGDLAEVGESLLKDVGGGVPREVSCGSTEGRPKKAREEENGRGRATRVSGPVLVAPVPMPSSASAGSMS
jgi:hypothetical protein